MCTVFLSLLASPSEIPKLIQSVFVSLYHACRVLPIVFSQFLIAVQIHKHEIDHHSHCPVWRYYIRPRCATTHPQNSLAHLLATPPPLWAMWRLLLLAPPVLWVDSWMTTFTHRNVFLLWIPAASRLGPTYSWAWCLPFCHTVRSLLGSCIQMLSTEHIPVPKPPRSVSLGQAAAQCFRPLYPPPPRLLLLPSRHPQLWILPESI